MPESLLSAAALLREALVGFEPGLLSGADCALVAEHLAATEKACAAVRLLAAARAVDAGTHRQQGFKDGATWLAQQSGTTGIEARRALDTASRLEDCPDTKAAVVAGHISWGQAGEIIEAERDTPGAEQALLPLARQSDLSRLRSEAREYRQAHTEAHDLHAQQQRARFFRHWRDRLGMVHFSGALPPETGLPLVRRIELATSRVRREGRPAGDAPMEPWERYAADALVALSSGHDTERRSERADLVIVCDLFAWRRGHTHPGEVCHLVDGGPLPVDLAQELTRDAFLAAVLHDGVNIHTVKRFGRYLPVELRTALDLGSVPEFSGRQCADCGRRWGLEYDHVDPVANHGPTSYANIQARCWPCHQDKTERDRQAGLLGRRTSSPPTPLDPASIPRRLRHEDRWQSGDGRSQLSRDTGSDSRANTRR